MSMEVLPVSKGMRRPLKFDSVKSRNQQLTVGIRERHLSFTCLC